MFNDGGVIRSILRSGEGYSEPKEGAKVVGKMLQLVFLF